MRRPLCVSREAGGGPLSSMAANWQWRKKGKQVRKTSNDLQPALFRRRSLPLVSSQTNRSAYLTSSFPDQRRERCLKVAKWCV